MSYVEALDRKVIAISISESADMPVLGLTEDHLRDAMAEIARHLLALGARLAYGGDLRQHGFTRVLLELVARYSRDTAEAVPRTPVTCYLAWPVHIQMSATELDTVRTDFEECATLRCLNIRGEPTSIAKRKVQRVRTPTTSQWSEGLTAMRKLMLAESDARIVLGGRVDHYKGTMPGIAEEALLSLQAGKPLFLLGGFGGCASDVAATIGLFSEQTSRLQTWSGHESFQMFSLENLNNGLSSDENRALARTPHVDQAITLVLRGLVRLGNATNSSE